jgi:NAD(P)-dependent dehydrogenase (short-subunit alcohol dehydrogenase family)
MGQRMVCVVTGATSGIGFEVARIFAGKGAEVIGVGRDPARCSAAAARLRALSANPDVRFEVADLSSLAEVRALAGRLTASVRRIDVLVNNAGGFAFTRQLTAEGIERQFALNYLSAFLLTRLLLPVIRAGRVIMVSSGSHYTGRIHWRDVGLSPLYNGLAAYDQSKLALVLLTRELARRLGPGRPVTVSAVDPGLVRTDIALKGTNALVRAIWRIRTRGGISPAEAAATVAWLALDGRAAGRSGLYWRACGVEEPSRRARDPLDARRLWDLSEKLCGAFLVPLRPAQAAPSALTAGEGSATLSA